MLIYSSHMSYPPYNKIFIPLFCIFLKDLFVLFLSMCVRECAHECRCVSEEARGVRCLELELTDWVPGPEPGSSARAGHTLNH